MISGFSEKTDAECRRLGLRLAKACGFEAAESKSGPRSWVGLRPPGFFGRLSYPDWRSALAGPSPSALAREREEHNRPFVGFMEAATGDPGASNGFGYSSPAELSLRLEAAGR